MKRMPYVNEVTDRAGRKRYYFRRHGVSAGILPGEPGSDEFLKAYADKLAGRTSDRADLAKLDRSFKALADDFFRSRSFTQLKPNSQRVYRSIITKMIDKNGHVPVRDITPLKVERAIAAISAKTPALGNLSMSVFCRVFGHACRPLHWISSNPASRMARNDTGRHHTWTDDECDQFERHWPLGTRERLAYELLLCTGQRIGDVARMSRTAISRDGTRIRVVQEKTGEELLIPLLPQLRAAIDALPAKGMVLLADRNGRQMTTSGVAAFMLNARRFAQLPKRCVNHGLRHRCATLLAEAGCTPHEIMAVTGIRTLRIVQHYTQAAEQKALAERALQNRNAKHPAANTKSL